MLTTASQLCVKIADLIAEESVPDPWTILSKGSLGSVDWVDWLPGVVPGFVGVSESLSLARWARMLGGSSVSSLDRFRT